MLIHSGRTVPLSSRKKRFLKKKNTIDGRDVPRAPTATPILSWKLLNECLLISSSLTVISVAKSIRSHRWPSGSWKREKRTVRWTRGQILSPWLGDIIDSGMGLSYRPASLCSLAGRYDNPMSESTISPSQGLRICQHADEQTVKGIVWRDFLKTYRIKSVLTISGLLGFKSFASLLLKGTV